MPTSHPISRPAKITVYGADWCPDCRRAKRLLASRAVDYDWVDLVEQPEIRGVLTANGYPAIPVIVMPDDTILMEPSDAALSSALDAVGAAAAS